MQGSKLLQWLKGLPLLLWVFLLWLVQTGPEEITSKTAAWAKWSGHPDLPGLVLAKLANIYVLSAASLVAVIYAFAVWVWPWWRNKHPRLVPLQDAALIGFEEAERLGVEDAISSIHQSLGDKLAWFQYAFLCDDTIEIFGKKRPSRQLRLIALEDRRRLKPAHTILNGLISDLASETLVYTDVAVTRAGLRKYLRKLRRISKLKL